MLHFALPRPLSVLCVFLFSSSAFAQTFNAAYLEKANTWSALQTFSAGATFSSVAPSFPAGAAFSSVAPTFTAGATFSSVAPSFAAGATFSGGTVAFSGASLTNPKVTTRLQLNTTTTNTAGLEGDDPGPTWAGLAAPYWANRLTVNSYPTNQQFADTATVVEGLSLGIDVPSTANFSTHGAALAAYGRTAATGVGAVGVFGQGRAAADGTTAWGANFVIENKGYNMANAFGIEVDINHTNTPSAATNISGVSVTGASDSQASGVFAAFIVNPAGIFEAPMIKWKNAFISQPGAATSGFALFTQDATGASPSQFIEIYGRDAGDAYHGAILQVLATGELDIRAADAGGIKITSNVAAPWLTLSTTGEAYLVGVSEDGSGKAVCIKADKNLGTCTDAVGGGGTCTCA